MVLIAPEAQAGGKPTEAGSEVNPWFVAPVAIAIGLLIFYGLASLVMDPSGYLSTDTGGKTATVAGMSERSDWSPEIGYWAEAWDPEGTLHPYWGTVRRGDIWVNVTSLPMVLAARPLWDLGGERAVLLLPMLGSVFAALAAGRLSVRFGAKRAWPTTLIVGLASPVAIYALDFWEHSIGLALMAWGFVWGLNALDHRSLITTTMSAGASGLAFGLAANMRQEAMIYGFVAGVFLFWNLWRVHQQSGSKKSSALWAMPAVVMAAGAITMIAANVALERQFYGSSLRVGRSATAISSGGSAGIQLRLTEAGITFASPINTGHWISVVLGAMVAIGLIWGTIGHLRRTEMRRPMALVGLGVLMLLLRLITFGPTFIPGMVAAAPLAGAGMGLAWLQKRPAPLVLALAPLPLVWYFQYPGAAVPQWGGRYVLATGLLLTAYAMGQWHKFGDTFNRWAKGLVVASGLITLIGLAFLSRRSHGFAEGTQYLADRSEPVLIFENPFLPRESGPVGVDEQWLAAWDRETRALALDLMNEAGFDSFGYVGLSGESSVEFDGFSAVNQTEVVLLEKAAVVFVTTYERVS
jgi:hypothetical protein